MAIQMHTINGVSDVKTILENYPPFNDTSRYSITVSGDVIFVKKAGTNTNILLFYVSSSSSTYASNDGFNWYTGAGPSFSITQTAGPTVAMTTSKGVIFATHANPSRDSYSSSTGAHYFTVMLAKDKNGNAAMACSGLNVANIGYIYASAENETISEISWPQVIRPNTTGDIGWQFPARTTQQIVTCPIATHPSDGTNYIDGGLLLLVTPVLPFGTVRIGDKNYATNGIMALED